MTDYLYKERYFSRANAVIFTVAFVCLLFALLYQLLIGPLGTRPASNQFLLITALLFFALAVNFTSLSVIVSSGGVVAAYGMLRHKIPRDNIEGCYLDETSAILYGGWGIRLGRVKGKWRLVYSVVGAPRVVLLLKKGWYREFAFSTRNPQEVINIIRNGLLQ